MNTNSHNTDESTARLQARLGREMHFTVPDGYFDELPGRVMNRLAERKRRRIVIRHWVAAAMLTGCVLAGGLLLERSTGTQATDQENLQAAAEGKVNVQYIEDALDYSMIDNMSIASYLTEADLNS